MGLLRCTQRRGFYSSLTSVLIIVMLCVENLVVIVFHSFPTSCFVCSSPLSPRFPRTQIMQDMWQRDPQARPSARRVVQRLEILQKQLALQIA